MNFGKINKIILFGGGNILLYAAEIIKNNNIDIVVFSAKRHLNEMVDGAPFHIKLRDNNVMFIESEDINTDQNLDGHIDKYCIGMSMGAAWIFKPPLIKKFNGRLINMHGSRLPQNKGGGGFSWQIMNQNRLGYCLIHLLTQGIDNGPVIKYKEFIYPDFCRIPHDYLNFHFDKNKEFFKQFVEDLKGCVDFPLTGQPDYLSTYWPRLSTLIHGYIDWTWPLEHVTRFINAFDSPYQGASTFIDDKKVYLRNCSYDFNDGTFHPFQTGIVYRISKEALFVACNQGTLIIREVFDDNGNSYKGNIKLGSRFYTPVECIEQAKKTRVTYLPEGLKNTDNSK